MIAYIITDFNILIIFCILTKLLKFNIIPFCLLETLNIIYIWNLNIYNLSSYSKHEV